MKHAIMEHFKEQGKRMSNIQKAKKDKLISIIEKYNINVKKYAEELKEQEKAEKEEEKQAEEEREKRRIEYKKEQEKKNKMKEKVKEYLDKKKISLTFLQRRRINLNHLEEELYFKNNADKIDFERRQNEASAYKIANKAYGENTFDLIHNDYGLKIIFKHSSRELFSLQPMGRNYKTTQLQFARYYNEDHELAKYYLTRTKKKRNENVIDVK